jgi:catalase
VLFDAIALLMSADGAKMLVEKAVARDFVADAFSHSKFIAYVGEATPLLEKAGIAAACDGGMIELKRPPDAADFVQICGQIRFWQRESEVQRA